MNKYIYYLSSIYNLLTGIKNWPLVVRVFLRIAPSGPYTIELRKSRLSLQARGIMDIWSIKETFLDRFYERFGTAVEDGWTVVDIGGGIGDYTLFAALANPHGKVYAFEPYPGSFALLQENLAANRLAIPGAAVAGGAVANVQAFPEAIWSQAGSLTIDNTVGEPGQFISRGAVTGRAVPGGAAISEGMSDASALGDAATTSGFPTFGGVPAQVASISLAEVFERLDIDHCDLMKIDCEGAEYPILFNAPEEVLDRVRRMVMEYHDRVTRYTHRDLQEFLAARGFAVRVVQNYVHPDLGYLYAWRNG